MVIKKDQLNTKRKGDTMTNFETFFFVALGVLSLFFLLITCWFLLTGDEHIFFQGVHISPRHLCILLSLQSFFWGSAMSNEHEHKSEVGHFLWSL